jgi:hypothetical protein
MHAPSGQSVTPRVNRILPRRRRGRLYEADGSALDGKAIIVLGLGEHYEHN